MRGPLWDEVLLEPDPDHVLIMSDGTVRDHANQIMSEGMVGQIREGYRCINCLEPFLAGPWPDECPVCRYGVKEKQQERFAREFVGNIRVGPSMTVDEELALAEELVVQQRLKRDGLTRSKAGVLLPRGL